MSTAKKLRVLVVGSGGREHALVKACLASPMVSEVIAAPGNGGMALEVNCARIDVMDNKALLKLVQEQAIQFVIIGPEAPLANGAADVLREAGIPVYGPGKEGALFEASKNHTKDFLLRHGIPTAQGQRFTDSSAACAWLETNAAWPIVIKADGLAAGKGVVICEDLKTAQATAKEMLDEGVFGDSGSEILIEEFMAGEEASVMLMVSAENYALLPFSQDHKRAFDGDQGPNTGGMGAYAPAAVVTPEIRQQVEERIIRPTLSSMAKEGIDYRGTLYIGIMLTDAGPKVVEFNVRFGDPECQVLLPLCKTDPVEIMYACANGELQPDALEVEDGYAAVIVLAAGGYPGKYKKGELVSLPASTPSSTAIIHAGTQRLDTGQIVTNGGRVLGLVGQASTLKAAVERAYALTETVRFGSCQYRKDIAHRQLAR